MPSEDACDMRGLLSFLILWLLSKKSMHGSELAEEIKKRRGEKPAAGTIYPALKLLKEKKWVVGTKEGKNIKYTLTKTGKRVLKDAMLYFNSTFGEIIKNNKRRS